MSTENLDGIYSYPAAADYRTNQYQFCVVNSSGQAALAGAGVLPDGLLHNLPNSGEQARLVHKLGVIVKVKLGGTVAIGDALSTDATGKGVKSVTTGHVRFGKFLKAGVSGDIVEALYQGYVGLVP